MQRAELGNLDSRTAQPERSGQGFPGFLGVGDGFGWLVQDGFDRLLDTVPGKRERIRGQRRHVLAGKRVVVADRRNPGGEGGEHPVVDRLLYQRIGGQTPCIARQLFHAGVPGRSAVKTGFPAGPVDMIPARAEDIHRIRTNRIDHQVGTLVADVGIEFPYQ